MINKTKDPSDWHNFLRHSDNKKDLFHFLSDKIAHMTVPDMIVLVKRPDVLSTSETSLDFLDKCFHEEANSQIFVHAKHAKKEGSKAIMIIANDTDVLVISLSIFSSLHDLSLQQLWVAFECSQNLRWIGVHEIYQNIGPERTKGILFFYAFTGCDIVSAFQNKGKKAAWQT